MKPFAALVATLLLGVLAACATPDADNYAALSNEALYAAAKESVTDANFEQAVKQLQALETRAAGTALAPQAQIDLAYAHYRARERAEALVAVDRFIRLYPANPGLDYAYYLKGLINFNDNAGLLSSLGGVDLTERDQQASREAHAAFKQLVERFPASRYREDAELRLNYIVHALASYEAHVARFYFGRGAYLAAANRAQQVLTEFPNAPATEEALALMAASYDRLELPELKSGAERVLKQNFPNSRYFTEGISLREKRWWHLW